MHDSTVRNLNLLIIMFFKKKILLRLRLIILKVLATKVLFPHTCMYLITGFDMSLRSS